MSFEDTIRWITEKETSKKEQRWILYLGIFLSLIIIVVLFLVYRRLGSNNVKKRSLEEDDNVEYYDVKTKGLVTPSRFREYTLGN